MCVVGWVERLKALTVKSDRVFAFQHYVPTDRQSETQHPQPMNQLGA